MAKELSFFDHKKIERLAKKASAKGIERATVYLWTVAKNSIKKTGRQKKYKLKVFLTGAYSKKIGRYFNYPKTFADQGMTVQQYLNSPDGQSEQIVQDSHHGRSCVRNPKTHNTYIEKKTGAAGKPPHTHKASQPGWIDFWLKKGIQPDKRNGVVYVNPSPPGKKGNNDQYLPIKLEQGGVVHSESRRFVGYTIYKHFFKNGKVTTVWRKAFTKHVRNLRMKPHPFLRPALAAAAEKLLKILEGSIGK